jgi:predicted ribosome quality control (RQC) complex YloA/Tae2 family protein
MSLNWKEINLILEELALEGSQIQKIIQPGYETLVLQVYGRGKSRPILICLRAGACRIHETFRTVPKSEKPLRFAEFLKARLVNGYIEQAVQLGDNRIIRLTVRRGENRCLLYIRLWSNAANVIAAAEDGTILDAMRRLPRRGETSGGIYRPEESTGLFSGRDYAVRSLPEPAGRAPEEGLAGFNEKAEAFYAEQGGLSLEKLREQSARAVGMGADRLEASLEKLEEKTAEYRNAGRWKEYGSLILANAAAIEHGAAWLDAEDGEGESIRIELDRTKNPVENAQAYYEKYRKGKKGLHDLEEELKDGRAELERLKETEAKLLAETNPLVLEKLLKKFRKNPFADPFAATLPQKGKTFRGPGRPGLSFQDGDWLLIVGRDGRENDELLRRHVRGNDLWLHARDYAGSYVFIKQRSGKTVPLEILLDAGNLAIFYSKGRNNGSGNCYYTQVKYLRRAKNGPPGKVLPSQEKNVLIKLDQKRLKKLEGARIPGQGRR